MQIRIIVHYKDYKPTSVVIFLGKHKLKFLNVESFNLKEVHHLGGGR